MEHFDEQNSAMSISDLMAGLMLFFMFISIAFMLEIQKENDAIKNIIAVYQTSKKELNRMLHEEFDKDLKRWNAEITNNNTVRFFIPFASGKSDVPEDFKKILDEFFPRYIRIVTDPKIKHEVDEIKVEGHTSNSWKFANGKNAVYLNNLILSQDRSKKVLAYLYSIQDATLHTHEEWLEKKFRANGMAFAKPIIIDGDIDWNKSRRVEFSIETKTEEKIQSIIERMKMDKA